MGKLLADRQMRSTPQSRDKWFSESVIYRHGSLVGRVTPSGERLFYFRYVNSKSKQINYPIGTYLLGDGGMSVDDAKVEARKLAELHKSGIKDIREYLEEQAQKAREAELEAERLKQAEAEAERARLEAERRELDARKTVSDLFDQWRRVKLRDHKDGGKEVIRIFQKDVLPEIGHLYATNISKAHITQITDKQMERGTKRLANRTFTLLRQMFRFAIAREITNDDPTMHLEKADIAGADTERDRVLTEDEIRDLAKQLPSAGLLKTTELAVWIALSTCCRIGELSKAKWEHIDLEKGQWFIPASNSKNKEPHTIILSQFAASCFERLKALSDSPAWCYPNRDGDEPLSTKSITKQLKDRQRQPDDARFKGRSKLQSALLLSGGGWTPHDLRRTGATLMVALGVIPEVAERCLNHVEEDKVKRTYQRHRYEPEMREAWQRLGQRLDILVNQDENKVVTLKRA